MDRIAASEAADMGSIPIGHTRAIVDLGEIFEAHLGPWNWDRNSSCSAEDFAWFE